MRFVWVWGVVAFLIRILNLDLRAMHHDEACNSWFVDRIFENGFFSYDPGNFHGPFYFYLLALSRLVFGDSIFSLRIISVLAGTALTLTPLLFKRFLSERAILIAVPLLALSPGLTVYSRDAIHEILFALLSVLAVWRYWTFREAASRTNALWLGLVAGLWMSTKETFVVLGLALLLGELIFNRGRALRPLLQNLHWVGLAALVPMVLLFTGGFQEPLGFLKFFKAFLIWGKRSMLPEGNGKPLFYFFNTLLFAETIVLGCAILAWRIKKNASRYQREVWFLGVVSLLIYSLMSYKMPWCVVSFSPFLILAGSAALASALETKSRTKNILVLAGLCLFSLYQGLAPVFIRVDDDTHPYVYAQTYSEFAEEVRHVLDLPLDTPMYVLSNTTWPLPYYLRRYKQVNYGVTSNPPVTPPETAMVLMIDEPMMKKMTMNRSPLRQVSVKVRPWAPPMVFTYFQGNP